MESGRISFLFFLGVLMICTSIVAQKPSESPSDSSQYYYRVLGNPTDYKLLPSAITYIENVQEARLKNGDTLNAITDLWYIANGQLTLDFYIDSERTAVEALHLLQNYSKAEEAGKLKLSIFSIMGRIFRAREDYQAAIEFYTAAIENDSASKEKLVLFNNIGNVYKDMEEPLRAKHYYDLAQQWAEKSTDTLNIARLLDNQGTIRDILKEEGALGFIEEALTLRKQKKNPVGIKSSYESLAKYYTTKDIGKARAYADSMKTIANRLGPEDRLEALRLELKLSDSKVGIEFQRLSDSLRKAQRLASNKYAYLLFNLIEEQQRSQQLQLNYEEAQSRILTYTYVTVVIFLVGIIIFFIFQSKNKRRRIRAVFETESRISKKVHDEVANDLYQVMTKVETGKQDTSATLDDLERIYEKTRDIAHDISELDVKHHFELQLLELLEGYHSEGVRVITRNLSGIPWEQYSEEKKSTLYRVLQELMTNMKKHSRASLVALTFQKENKKLHIGYSDNGVGGAIIKGGGLQNTENRMDAIGGSISFESETGKGFRAHIII